MRYASTFPSPIGALTAVVDEDGALMELRFERQPAPDGVAWDDARCAHVRRELDEYFAGARREFGVALKPRGTPWQQAVWTALQSIPCGATIDYRALAALAGNPRAVRAAGRANATNPIPILIPCHRVIGSDGSLTGYGGGLEAKERLILLEGGRKTERGRVLAARCMYVEDRFGAPRLLDPAPPS
ncbi:methylated-DNA--[protein]-cysteine S-methyltransferase [Longimicrobium sp.]|uniref:methylated-DNA--[protein]-cysteine S-methyltransferase n=1 Tax=Longimicrobium sp. TaxID=2029185 RepID=UPI002BE86FCE|nr:methylated-DNA--[protein]-cysteine S-methyltransferase [Longimicrobium sp.]HSU15056.1 methylated-DNA--[protein]-cysteine S-methyltransferase [Longimicrobium sp.]